MNLLVRHVLGQFLKFLALGMAGALNIFLAVEFIERVDDFIEKGASLADAANYFLFKIPQLAVWSVPLAVLMAVVLCLLTLSRQNEVTAMRACGVSLHRVVSPLLLASLGLSVLTFFANEYVIPYTNRRVSHILNVRIKGHAPRGFRRVNRIWYRSEDGTIWHIEFFDPFNDRMKGVSLLRPDGAGGLRERVDAAGARWEGGRWWFEEGFYHRFSAGGGVRSEPFSRRTFPLEDKPSDFKRTGKDPAEMSFGELREYIHTLRVNGLDPTRYEVDLQAKLSLPLVSFVLALVGVPFSLRTSRSGGIALGVALTLLIGFLYLLLYHLGLSLGHAGLLPPVLAAWAGNILFAAAGTRKLIEVRN
ncbi:MAG: LPS export ABC transporter permease LptG [Nitrospinota bacterium]